MVVRRETDLAPPQVEKAARPRVLLVDEDMIFAQDLELLVRDRFELPAVVTPDEARRFLLGQTVDAMLLAMGLDHGEGSLELLDFLQVQYPEIPVIMLCAEDATEHVVAAVKRGADDCIRKRPSREVLLQCLDRAIKLKRTRIQVRNLQADQGGFDEIIGDSASMREVKRLIQQYSRHAGSVLVQGPSGCGKELVARAIHGLSDRGDEPFIVVNCAAFIDEERLEAELFGYEQGAFAGADRRRLGRLQEAARGTLFLDEVAAVGPLCQIKLMRVLSPPRQFRPIGGHREVPFQARIIAASNRDLVADVRAGRFRDELLFRLNALRITLRPLVERPEDIEPLVHHFIHRKSLEMKRATPTLDQEALGLLQSYGWPGNVRELAHVVEGALYQCEGAHLRRDHFQDLEKVDWVDGLHWRQAKERSELQLKRRYYSSLLQATKGVVVQAARLAGLPRQTVHRHLREAGLDRGDFTARRRRSDPGKD
jgi:two-component system response regulator HydG